MTIRPLPRLKKANKTGIYDESKTERKRKKEKERERTKEERKLLISSEDPEKN